MIARLRDLMRPGLFALLSALLSALMVAACSPDQLPKLPGLPDELRDIPGALQELQLPDLSGIELPSLDSLPALNPPADAIVYSGPAERSLAAGDRIPGTDITFAAIRDGAAVFKIAGLESVRRAGDALDFDGEWPGLPGSSYHARLRLYHIGADSVRVAGVHQLLVPQIAPIEGPQIAGVFKMTFPFIDGVARGGELIAGTTYGYMGRYERGAQLSGIGPTQYPYRSVGDSIEWNGELRPGVGVEYDLRLIVYGMESMRVGGTVTLHLPAQ